MIDWSQLSDVIDFCAVYFTTQLVRCTAFSFVLIGLVMLLRRVLFSRQVFLRGMLWSLFLVIPFLGKLKLFYENGIVLHMTWKLTCVTMKYIWVDRIYVTGILATVLFLLGKRLRLRKIVSGMEQSVFEQEQVYVTNMNITPFTAGLLVPKIILPRAMLEHYSRDELRTIVLHEQTHIRLGHLWYGFAWDILQCLLWVNPFLAVCRKYLWADMEDICDRVCIQKSGRMAHEYGLVLLKSLKLLSDGQEEIPTTATYAGEKEFSDMKRRMEEIAGFRPYKKGLCTCMVVVACMAIAAVLFVIHTNSYARYSESNDIMIGNDDGEPGIVSTDTEELRSMIFYDDSYVYVDRDAFEDFLCRNNANGDIYIIFGGYYKLPGLGGMAEGCVYERGSTEEIVQIPYESIMNHWVHKLCKLL
ncbi:MAG: M56 family metallopeptidase [Clostridium sp.]|nr:M56 family metallopeptidase [Clostridium sp.]MCM1399767.1 M56 family metallopeptidase [Clostridium sp.]MCM1459606.1 M56 family metallopeptidase [Bacteroides sp.]